ncbi:MAG: hypothetical protein Q9222_004124, partial [Ikaeria aurantiellina]
LQFRLRLLRFTYTFVHSQPDLRQSATGSTVRSKPDQSPQIKGTRVSADYQPGSRVPNGLYETLPMFLALSATQNTLQESTITELWMRLAAGYMAQAYVEQVLVCHNTDPALLQDTFRFGLTSDPGAAEGNEDWQVHQMFTADNVIARLWEDIKHEHMQAASQIFSVSL